MVEFLYASYAGLFGPAAMVFLLFLICALWIPRYEHNWAPITLGLHEITACLLFAAMPFTIFVAAQFVQIASFSRYVQPVVIGFSIAIAMFAYRVGGRNGSFRNLAVSLVVWLGLGYWTFLHFLNLYEPEPWTAIQAEFHFPVEKVSLPLIIDNDEVFVDVYHYAPPELRNHLFYLYDPQSAIKYTGADTTQRSLFIGQTFHDFHLVRYDEFVHQNPEFLVARPKAHSWILQRLLEDGAEVQLIQLNKERSVLAEDHQLFHVKVSPNQTGEK
jgi:hypothetical protein